MTALSMQSKHAVDGMEFGRFDQLGVRDGDCEERTLDRHSQNARKCFSAGNSETYRSPAKRKLAAARADPDVDKRSPLLSVRSLRPAEMLRNWIFLDHRDLQPNRSTMHESQFAKK
jgi:hypothetical protein